MRKKLEEWFHTIHHADGSVSQTNRLGYEQEQKALNTRRALGRYTLDEAALTLADATGERANEILKKLMNAATDGNLKTYEPGKELRYSYGPTFAERARDFHEEAYWNDLNVWLEENESRIIWRFPAPASALASAAEEASIAIWTPEKREQLRQEHAALVSKKHKSPTKELATRYKISTSRIRELKAKEKGKANRKPNQWNDLKSK
ncbi:MAG: hypothetical protein ABI771_00335 [Betaproteobacteria bacterium]